MLPALVLAAFLQSGVLVGGQGLDVSTPATGWGLVAPIPYATAGGRVSIDHFFLAGELTGDVVPADFARETGAAPFAASGSLGAGLSWGPVTAGWDHRFRGTMIPTGYGLEYSTASTQGVDDFYVRADVKVRG